MAADTADRKQDEAGPLSQLPSWWPVIISLAACGALLVTTQTTLGYVARDVAELRADVKGLTGRMNDRYTATDQREFIQLEFSPLRDAQRALELRVALLERSMK